MITTYAGTCRGCRLLVVKGGTSIRSWFIELHILGHYVGICR